MAPQGFLIWPGFGLRGLWSLEGAVMQNFIECATLDEANAVDLTKYTFLRFSDSRNRFLFKIREDVRRGSGA